MRILDLSSNGTYSMPARMMVYGIVLAIELNPVTSIMNAMGPVSQDQLASTDAGAIIGIEDPAVWFEVQTDTFATTNKNGLFNLKRPREHHFPSEPPKYQCWRGSWCAIPGRRHR